MIKYLVLLLLLISFVDASTNRVNEITTNGTDEDLIVNASGSQIIFERDLNLTEDFFWSGLQWFYDNATDQDAQIQSLITNDTGQETHISELWSNASDQDGRIIDLEARPLQPNIDADNITSGIILNARLNDTWLVTTSDCSVGEVLIWPSTCVAQWPNQPNIDAMNVTSGQFSILRMPDGWMNKTYSDSLYQPIGSYITSTDAQDNNITDLWANASSQETKISGLRITYLNKTTATYSGAVTSGSLVGYQAANDLCNLSFSNSTFCRSVDVMAYIAYNSLPASIFTGTAWMANGPPGYTANANDCLGFTSAVNTYYGAFWEFNVNGGGMGWLVNCASTKPLACCR